MNLNSEKEKKSHRKAGFVSIVGLPNVGKSTLLNRLVGEKLAGVSAKPQTTREIVRGILTYPLGQNPIGQIVFLDTPGVHTPYDSLGKAMVHSIKSSIHDVDIVYWMVFPKTISDKERDILTWIKKLKIPVILVINQLDRFPKENILVTIDSYQKLFGFREYIPISAKTGQQVDLLIEKTIEYLPVSEFLFPEDQISDQNERFHVGEMIREKLYHYTGQELPYDTTVVIDEFKEASGEEKLRINATILVARKSQKNIVIGSGGSKIKQIGKSARRDIEKFLGQKVYLELWVKIDPDWKQKNIK